MNFIRFIYRMWQSFVWQRSNAVMSESRQTGCLSDISGCDGKSSRKGGSYEIYAP